MYQFGALDYVNSLAAAPDAVNFSVYGLLAIRTIASIVLKMVVNEDACHVHLVYEGGGLDLDSALEHISECLQ